MKTSNSLVTRRAALVAGASLLATPWTRAQGRPLRLVVAGPAGGNADLVARIVAEPLSRELGQPVIVDPKPGAAGAIAVGDLLQSPHDGQTLLVGVNSLVSEIPHIVRLKWDMSREIRPLAELARGPLVLVAAPNFAGRTVADVVAQAKSGRLSYASYSAGTMSHVLGLVLARAAGVELTHVAYKGSSPALADVMGGHVPLMFDGLASSLPLIRAGKVKAIAVTSPRRVPQLPDVPTFRETGYPQMDALSWLALWSPPDVPAAAQQRVRDAALKVLANPDLRHRLQETGLEAGQARTTDDMTKELQADYERVGGILRSIGFKPE